MRPLWGVLMLGLLAAPAARAQTSPPAPSAPGILVMPPRVTTSTSVPYPEGATGDASVVLALTVGADGSVADAGIVSGEEPFASAAADAAKGWRFDPATREGKPVAAKIRFALTFHAPKPSAPEPEPEPAPTPSIVAAPTKPPEPLVQSVTVTGSRAAPGAMTLGRAEVRQLPGAFGDPFRALDALPGVTPIVSGLPFFYVRGAPPGNVGYFIDGVKVPYLFHVGAGPSVIHPGMVDRVDLYPGGYPAQFGRFAGGIVSATTTDPRPELHGEYNLRLFDAGALVETGFADGKGTALVGGRYSYTATILSLIAKDTRLDYRDYTTRVTYDLGPKDRISVVGFGAFDLIAQTTNGIESILFGAEFYRGDVRYDHVFANGATARVALTAGFDQSHIPGQPRNSKSSLGAARLELMDPVSSVVTVRGGADATLEHYTADSQPYSDPDDPTTQQFNALFPQRDDVTVGAWADAVFRLPHWEITPGIRADVYNSGSATKIGVDPRIASRLDLTNEVHVIHTFGLAHQPPSFVIPVPGLAIGTLKGGLQQSIQSSAGVEVDLPEAITATVTAFDNIFQNMSDTLGASSSATRDIFGEPRSLGSAIGLEVYVRRKLTKKLGGYISYTLSRSTREVGTEKFLSAFDRPHVANAALAYDLGRNWRAGGRFTIYSGTPVIPEGNSGLVAPPRSLDPARDPAFYRIDLRLEKRWNLARKNTWISFVAEMMNVTLHKEYLQGTEIGPVSIPSLGVEGAF